MPSYRRWREDGATDFFTLVTYNRRPVLTSELGRRLLRGALEEVRSRRPFDMPVSVLLPDHFHCIWAMPADDDDFPGRWAQIKERFTRTHLASGGSELRVTNDQRRQRRRGVWQPRYWEHRIRDEKDYVQHRDYIHFNPVKHGLTRTPEEWPWSTVHEHLRTGELAPDWWNSVRLVLPDLPE